MPRKLPAVCRVGLHYARARVRSPGREGIKYRQSGSRILLMYPRREGCQQTIQEVFDNILLEKESQRSSGTKKSPKDFSARC